MSNIDRGPAKRRSTGIYAADRTIGRPSMRLIDGREPSRPTYVYLASLVRAILAEVSADVGAEAHACAFPITVDGVTYLFNAEIEEGTPSVPNSGKLTCRFVVGDDTDGDLMADEGYIMFPGPKETATGIIASYNLCPDFPLRAIVEYLETEKKRSDTANVRAQVGKSLRTRKMTSFDLGPSKQAPGVSAPRKKTSYPLDELAKKVAVHLIMKKDNYGKAAARVQTLLPGNRPFEVVIRRVDEGLWLSYRYDSRLDFVFMFVPLNLAGEAYLRIPHNPPWEDLIFALGIE